MPAIARKPLALNGGSPAVTHRGARRRRFDESEREALLAALQNENLFRYLREDESQVLRLEKRFAEIMGVKYALAVNSGTSALIAGLMGLGIGPGDEVIVPGYTYIASAAAIINVMAVPVIAEVDDSLTLDPEDVRRKITSCTKAIMPVHMRGTPSQMEEIRAIAKEHGLLIIEDVAQACGGAYRGKRLGSIGNVGCFSLQHFKIITTGEGGAVITDDPQAMARAQMYHDSGRPFWEGYEGEAIPGVNFRMSELGGALGRVQIEKLDGILERQRAAKRRIVAGIRNLPGIQLQRVPDEEGDCAVGLVFFARTPEDARRWADALNAEGAGCGTMYSKAFPDRHIYCYWDHILEKKGYTEKGSPWNPALYSGSVSYSKDMCPQTLDYLGRAVAVGISQWMDEKECDQYVEAFEKAADAFAG
jgi:8-amino-3,8-dideoxy-alpha-D-manno-octulosonate transaminase